MGEGQDEDLEAGETRRKESEVKQGENVSEPEKERVNNEKPEVTAATEEENHEENSTAVVSIEQGASPVHGNENKNISVLNTDEKTHLIINAVDEGTVSVLGDLISVLWHRKWSFGCAVQVYDVTSCMIACLQTHNGLQWFSLYSESRWNKVLCKHESLCLIVCFVWLCTWLCSLHLRWIERESSVVVYSGPRCDKISCVGGRCKSESTSVSCVWTVVMWE